MNKDQLNKIGIHQWEDLSKKYECPNLLLGNGFSINLSSKFSYNSLFDTFLINCKEEYIEVFKNFGTTNFELILKYLNHARKVNEILGIEFELIDDVIQELKQGLIKAIKQVHPNSHEIDWNRLDNITMQLDGFNDIYSTNYDLFLYHIIMKSKDFRGDKKIKLSYQDYFWGTYNNDYKLFKDYQNYHYYKHIYYLHGALALFSKGVHDLKILRNSSQLELISIISKQIEAGNFPTFITEGSSEDKMNGIRSNNYLYFCFKELKKSKHDLLIFGNSLSEHDQHIVNILRENPRNLIYGIYIGERTETEILEEKYSIINKFPEYSGSKYSIEFIDSRSVFN